MITSNTAFSSVFKRTPASSIVMSDSSFEKWRKYIYDKCGIYFNDNKKYLLESRLLKRMNYLNHESYDDYLNYLLYDAGGRAERTYLFEAITINETFFFRNQPQLDALIGTILPEMIEAKSKSGSERIKIWSAGSSSGEEPYSVAIAIDDLMKTKAPSINFEITGTDISEAVIETAKKGIYKSYSLRNTSAYYMKKYFKLNNGEYELNPAIRERVNFKTLNLYDEQSMRSMFGYDIILCANVLIYFDVKSKIKVIQNLYQSLTRGGYLFIGYSETLHNISQAFKLVSFPKTVGYKKE